jgi:K+-transporting ATPase KdpF subunit
MSSINKQAINGENNGLDEHINHRPARTGELRANKRLCQIATGQAMSAFTIAAGVIAAVLALYLVAALLAPEDFT